MSQRRVFERASASSIRYALRSFPRTAIQRRFASDEMPKLTGAADNAFNRERMAVKQHAGDVAIPALILASINGKILWDEHWEHWATLPPLEERVEYDYQNIRTKKFPWGDGDKTLFWNDKVNYHKKDK
ncbi:MAG: hypothetical protein Q9228_000276 [Teloschistes exilis]